MKRMKKRRAEEVDEEEEKKISRVTECLKYGN